MITEKNNVFYCDCGFSFLRGHSGAHDCAVGLRNKLAKSEARCAALAAENAGLRGAIDATIGWQQSTDSENVESVRMLVDVKTPATDAFLAEVRAQARNELINELEARFTELSQTSPTSELRSGAAGAAAFISTFRKGVQS